MFQPTPHQIQNANITKFMQKTGYHTYAELHQWSIKDPEFWREIWEFMGIIGDPGTVTLDGDGTILGSTWFRNGTLNYAENILKRMPDHAIVYWAENRVKRDISKDEVILYTAKLYQTLAELRIKPKDRIAAVLSNRPESLVGLLASSLHGAIWSSCSPDFGVQGILDRFGQINPKVLLTAPTYLYNGKIISITDKILELAEKLPDLETIIILDNPEHVLETDLTSHPKIKLWSQFVDPITPQPLEFKSYPFNHPLYILYSSGTTGIPKCIVHSAGGSLIQHMKEHQFHCDIKPLDRLFYFTTLGWMMWNWLMSGAASGATLLLYDGSPFYPKGNILFDLAQTTGMTHFGTSAKYIDSLKKINLKPLESHDLRALKLMMSTGSPLAPESFDYVTQSIKQNMPVASISGGTDIVSCFVLGCPILPVHRGEIQVAGLGLDIAVFNDQGQPITQEKGELICRNSFPVRPLEFWNDPDQSKFKAAYFNRFPPFWAHGDYCEQTANNGYIIHGRSDAVLNPGGVRIGTAEIYRQVEQIDEVLESIAVGQNWQNDVRVILFVKLRPGIILDDILIDHIKKTIKDNASPRHVPAKILAVGDIPRTKSGKIVELAVKAVIHQEQIKNIDALANPEALDHFKNLDALTY